MSLSSRPLQTRPLPAVRRWWTLPPGVVPDVRVDEDSFSSMNLYLGAPHQWVLRYGARLEPSGLLDLPPPLPGEHSEHLLAELGLTPDEIAALIANRTVGTASS